MLWKYEPTTLVIFADDDLKESLTTKKTFLSFFLWGVGEKNLTVPTVIY